MNARTVVALMIALILPGAGRTAGDAAFQRGDYVAAADEYRRALAEDPSSGILHYNLGATLLRLGRYDEAQRHLATALAVQDAQVRQFAHYNGGNGDLYPAIAAGQGNQREAMLRTAIAAYREALLLDPDDFDAKWNLELAERLLHQSPAGGGGGGGGGGAGTGDDPTPAQPSPRPADGQGPEPQMTPAQAEELLEAARDRDRELNEQKLQRGTSAPAGVRDW